jgi:hypothetical protein
MSKQAFDKRPTPGPRKKDRIDPYTSRILKTKSKARREQNLKHAVTHGDVDALEDYDEYDFDA